MQTDWVLFWKIFGLFTFGLVAGFYWGYGWGKFRAQMAYWQRRDAEWDAEHLGHAADYRGK